MSLINQVLNDLEKRGASTNIGEATIRVVPIRKNHGTLWIFIAAISVSVLVASAWLKWGAETQISAAQIVLSVAPVTAEAQPSSQPSAISSVSADDIPAAINPPAARLNSMAAPAKTENFPLKPLLLLKPVITAVSPNPAISKGAPQAITITGNHFADDATVVLYTPTGREFAKRKIVEQNSAKIVISANFGNSAGQWSVEVANTSDHTSGQFTFAVLTEPVVARAPAQDKPALPAASDTRSAVKPATAAVPAAVLPAGGVSKQPTQITAQQQAENEFRKAYALMQQGQTHAAISGYETAIKLDAGHNVARQTLVRLLLENKRNAEAERMLREGLQHDPKQSSMAMLLARMQVGRNELDQALETMQKSLPYAEKQADYQSFVAALLQRKNQHKEAISYFQNALQLSPNSGVWLMGLGISLRAEQRTDEARDAFRRALESNNLSAELQSFVKQQLKEL